MLKQALSCKQGEKLMAGDYEILCRCCPLLITEYITSSKVTCLKAARWMVKQKVVALYFVLLQEFII